MHRGPDRGDRFAKSVPRPARNRPCRFSGARQIATPSTLRSSSGGCVGCAGTQSARAFIPRPAAEVVPAVTIPNCSGERNHSLAESLVRSLQEQEDEPMLAVRQSAVADKPVATWAVYPEGDGRASKMAGSPP